MTLMDEASRGRVTREIDSVAKCEQIEPERLARLVAAGRVVIPRNIRREDLMPMGIGELLTTKVNVNVGTSQSLDSIEAEVEKALAAVHAGANAVMDLSTGGDLDQLRRKILGAVHIPVGTVPIYSAAVKKDLTCQGLFDALEKHARDGVDFVTVHVGVNKNTLERLRQDPRIMGVVSRGGSLTMKYIAETGEDNPYYSEYDYLLEIAREYDLTLSLGDGLRPGCIEDASDRAKYMEFIMLGELVRRARSAGVQVMVEGPGHVPADEIQTSVLAMKHLCDGAPLYLLGPLVTDIAPGYDHITAAMGGVIAGMAGGGLPLRHDAFRAPGSANRRGCDRGHLRHQGGGSCSRPHKAWRAGACACMGPGDGQGQGGFGLGRAVSCCHQSGQGEADPPQARG